MLVRLYWWNARLAEDPSVMQQILPGGPAVENTAHFCDVDATECLSEKQMLGVFHAQKNGHGLDNIVGWNEAISLTISEDELCRPAFTAEHPVNPTTKRVITSIFGQPFVLHLVEAWENAKFRWIRADNVNGGVNPLRVTFQEAPKRAHPDGFDLYNEYSYRLNGEVVHQNI